MSGPAVNRCGGCGQDPCICPTDEDIQRAKIQELESSLAAMTKRAMVAERQVRSLERDALAWDRTVRSLARKVVCLHADNTLLLDALKRLQDMQIVETLPIIEAALQPGRGEGGWE